MTDTENMSTIENRITRGIDQLSRSCAAWLTGTDLPAAGRTRAVLGRAIGGGIATWFLGGLAYELGPIAWGSVGVLTCLSVWVAGAPGNSEPDDEDQDDDEEHDALPLDVDAFRELVTDVASGRNVHLVEIRRQLAQETGRDWSGPEATALCDAAGIRVRAGVRVPGAHPAVTTGIHRDDLPPLSPGHGTAPVGVVPAGQHSNTNSNTTIERIGEGAASIIKHGPSTRQEARS